jgi:hypothetical protein
MSSQTQDQQTPAETAAPAAAPVRPPTTRALLASCVAARTVSTPPDRVNPADENAPAGPED